MIIVYLVHEQHNELNVYSASLLREKNRTTRTNYRVFAGSFWELPPKLNWEILSTFLSTKYESEMNWGNNKQNNFAVEFISLNYSIMYLSFLFLNLFTNVSRSLSDSLSFPSMDILIRPSKFLWVNLDLRAWQRSFNQIHIWKPPSHSGSRGRDDIHQVKKFAYIWKSL